MSRHAPKRAAARSSALHPLAQHTCAWLQVRTGTNICQLQTRQQRTFHCRDPAPRLRRNAANPRPSSGACDHTRRALPPSRSRRTTARPARCPDARRAPAPATIAELARSSPLALHARSSPLAPSDRDPPNSPASIRMDSRDIIRSIPSISATRSVAWLPTPDWSPPRLQPVLVRSMHWLQMRRAEWRCGTTQPGVGDRGTAEPRKPPSRSGLQPAMRMHAACQSG